MNSTKLLTVLSIAVLTWLVPIGHSHAQNQSAGSGFSNLLQNGGLNNLMNTFNLNRSPGIEQQTANPMRGLQGLLPSFGQPSNPGTDIIARVNQKSKDAIDKTTGWARQKKQELTSKMMGNALGGMLSGLKLQDQGHAQSSSPFNWLKSKSTQMPTQPPLRSAQNYEQQPSLRY